MPKTFKLRTENLLTAEKKYLRNVYWYPKYEIIVAYDVNNRESLLHESIFLCKKPTI